MTACRTFSITTGVITAGLLLGACGIGFGGDRTTEDRDVDGLAEVTAVSLETSGDLVIELGEETSLTVTAGDRVMDRLTSEVRDGVLVLGSNDGVNVTGDIDYQLVLSALDAIRVLGSGDVEAGAATAESLTVEVRGSGDVTVHDVDVEALEVEIEGSGNVELSGVALRQVTTIRGSGGFDGSSLESEDAVVVLEGSGDAEVDVSDALSATIRGSGDLTYTGGAQVSADVEGSGEVREG
ncbi:MULTISPECIES: head GIN domain-containing protein [unclassified Actinotalea]|uniref:head GIN domain-containing protein n=1 Tax=unclassified Actinotalea TaxID=2638618 RepID=UPI0015F680A9|nr:MULTISPECIES: head GIN domain-containing protein [unclassified Actinotalea]